MPSTDPAPALSPASRPGLIRRTIRKRWVPILTRWALLTVALMSAVYVLPAGPYEAASLLRVDPAKANLFDGKPGDESMDAFLQTQVQLITSPNVLTAAATNPKAAVLPRIAKAGDVVQELRKAVHVGVVPGTHLIEVSVTSTNPREAATIVNAVVESFIEANSEWSDGMARVQIKNLEQYNVDLKNQTDELERRWKRLAAKGDLDFPAKQANLVSPEHGAKIEEKLVANDLARLEAQAQLDAHLARPSKDQAKIEELATRVDAANRLEKALNERRASAGFNPRNASARTDEVEMKLLQDERQNLRGMQEAIVRRLEQLRFEAKGEARIRPVNPNGAMVPGKPISDHRPMLLTIIPFATFALVFSFFAGVEAWSGSKVEVETKSVKAEPEAEA